VRVHSLALSYIPESMKHDSRASLLAHTLANPCLGHEPNAKVTIDFKDEIWISRGGNVNPIF
jgi:hypothetical protein